METLFKKHQILISQFWHISRFHGIPYREEIAYLADGIHVLNSIIKNNKDGKLVREISFNLRETVQ